MFLTGMQVLGNPGIAVCEQNGTAGNGSEMMANGTTGEGDVTCVTCGKLYPEKMFCVEMTIH